MPLFYHEIPLNQKITPESLQKFNLTEMQDIALKTSEYFSGIDLINVRFLS